MSGKDMLVSDMHWELMRTYVGCEMASASCTCCRTIRSIDAGMSVTVYTSLRVISLGELEESADCLPFAGLVALDSLCGGSSGASS